MKRVYVLLFLAIFWFVPVFADDFVVVIDPGHGGDFEEGRNDGTQESHGVSANNASITLGSGVKIQEKALTLKYSKALAEKLNAQPGMKAILTRDSDVSLSAMTRAAVAVQNQADVYLSIHFNSGGGSGPRAYVVAEDHSQWEYFHFHNPYVKRDAYLAESLVEALEKKFAAYGGKSSATKVYNDTQAPTNDHGLGKGSLKDGIRNIGYARMDSHLYNAAVVLLEVEFMDTLTVAKWLLGPKQDEVMNAAAEGLTKSLLEYRDSGAAKFQVSKAKKAVGR
jgi:N-acetylmuramoyl-L-alanine amidase